MRSPPLGPSVAFPAYWGHETCEGVPTWEAGAHAVTAAGAFGGAPHLPTKRARGVPSKKVPAF